MRPLASIRRAAPSLASEHALRAAHQHSTARISEHFNAPGIQRPGSGLGG